MIFNLVDKEGTKSGKKQNFSLLGLNDNVNKKDAGIFKKISEGLKEGTIDVEKLEASMKKLSPEAYKTAKAINMTGDAGGKLSKSFLGASQKAKALGTSSKVAAIGIKALNIAMNMALTLGIGLAIEGVMSAIDKLIVTQQEAIDKANEITTEWKNQDAALKSNKKSIEGLSAEYQALSAGVDQFGNNISLTTEEYEKYNSISEQFSKMFPDLIQYHTDNTGKLVAEKIAVTDLNEAYENQKKAYNNDVITKASDAFKGFKAATSDGNFLGTKASIDSQLKLIEYVVNNYDKLKNLNKSDKDNILKESGIEANAAKMSDLLTNAGIAHNTFGGVYSLFDKLLDEENFSKVKAYFGKLNAIVSAESSKNKPIMKSMFEESFEFNQIDNTVQNNIESILSKFDYQFYKNFTTDMDVSEWLDNNILKPMSDPKNGKAFQDAINTILSPDNIKLPANEYEKVIKDALAVLPSDLQKQLSVYLKLDIVTDDMKRQLKDKVGEIDTSDLTVEEIRIILNPKFEFDSSSSTSLKEQVKAFVDSNLPPVEIQFTSLSDQLKDITTKTSALADAWKEMSETGYLSADAITKLVETDANWADSLEIVNGKVIINKNTLVGSAKDIILAKKTETQAVIESCKKQIDALQLTAKAAMNTAKAFLNSASAIALANGAAGASGKMYADQMQSIAGGNVEGVKAFNEQIKKSEKELKIFDSLSESLDDKADPFGNMTKSAKKAADAVKDLSSSYKSAIDNLLSMTMNMIKQENQDIIKGLQESLDKLTENYNTQKDSLDELYDSQKKNIDGTYNAEKDWLDTLYKQQKKIYDDQKEAIENQKNALKKELDARLEALRLTKEKYYYEKDLAKQNKNISELQSDIGIISNDDSLEGIAKKEELEAELAAKKEELADKQFDHSIELQEDALNNEYNKFEEIQNGKLDLIDKEMQRQDEAHQQRLDQMEAEHDRALEQLEISKKARLDALEATYNAQKSTLETQLKDVQDYVANEGQIRADAIKMIEDKSSGLYEKLIDYNKKYGDGVNATVKVAWDNAYAALGQFNNGQINVIATLEQLITKMNDFTIGITGAVAQAGNLSTALQGANADANNAKNSLAELQMQLESALKQQSMLGMYGEDPNKMNGTINNIQNQIDKYPKHHNGAKSGFVGGLPPRLKSNEVFAKLLAGELVITPEQIENFMTNQMPSISVNIAERLARNSIMPQNISPSQNLGEITVTQGDIVINGNMDKSILESAKALMRNSVDELTEMVCEKIVRQQHLRGVGGAKVF